MDNRLKEELDKLGAAVKRETARPQMPARCAARRSNEEMACLCGLRWDLDDPEPPVCPATA